MVNKLRALKYQLVQYLQNSILIPICRKNRFLSNFYYCFFSNEFSREHQKVLNGRHIHHLALKKRRPNEFHLRREIHRLEKGLIMKEKRDVFALDYIMDTVNNYKILSHDYSQNGGISDPDLLKWAHSVINSYFNSVSAHPIIDNAKRIFDEIQHESTASASIDRIPFQRLEREYNAVSYEDIYKLALQRRSVRWYLDKPVPRELIDKALAVATLSPSACNRQPFSFRIFDSKEMKDKVGAIPMGIKGFYENVPVFVVLVGKLSAYLSERDRHVIYIDGGLASMSFMLALETLGLSSLPINWPDIEKFERKMESTLNLAPDERPLMLIGIGYPDKDGKIPYSQKKSSQYLVKYNQ